MEAAPREQEGEAGSSSLTALEGLSLGTVGTGRLGRRNSCTSRRWSRWESFYDEEACSVWRPVQNYTEALRKGGKAAILGRKTRYFQIERPQIERPWFTCVG